MKLKPTLACDIVPGDIMAAVRLVVGVKHAGHRVIVFMFDRRTTSYCMSVYQRDSYVHIVDFDGTGYLKKILKFE